MIPSSNRLASCAAMNQRFHQALTQYYAPQFISNSVFLHCATRYLTFDHPCLFIGIVQGCREVCYVIKVVTTGEIDEITHLQPFNSSRPSRASLLIRFFALLLDSPSSGNESFIISHWPLLALYRVSHLLRSVLTIVIFGTVRDSAK